MTKQPNFGPIFSQKSEIFASYMCSCDTEGIYKQHNEISISPMLLKPQATLRASVLYKSADRWLSGDTCAALTDCQDYNLI